MAEVVFRIGDTLKIEGVEDIVDVQVVNIQADLLRLSGITINGMKSGQEVVVWLVRADALYRFIGELRAADFEDETLITGIKCVSRLERVQRRTEFRTPCKIPVTINSVKTGERINCRAFDISSRGIGILDEKEKTEYILEAKPGHTMGIESDIPYKEGEKIECTFRLGDDSYISKAIVRRCYRVGGGTKYRIGAQFTDMDYREAKKLQKSIFKLQIKQR